MEQTIRNLIDELNRLTKLYNEGHPEVSDEAWDNLYFQLEKMEKEQGIIYPDSPTQTIIYEEVPELQKIKHNHPMLSLAKTKDIKEVQNFVSGHDWFGMFKMDGLTVSLTYEKGRLKKAETRGDGIIGEDIWHNAIQIKSIPRQIPIKDIGYHIYNIADTVVIDGEIICTYDDFEQFKNEYKNPRNFAAGSIRLLNSAETASRNLTFVAWDLVEGIDEDFLFWRLEKLDDWGFQTVPRIGDAETISDAIEILNKMKEDTIYPIDGYVFKFESKKYGDSLGKTDHHFKNAIAYKFYDDEYETKLKYINYDVSRNGILTPVAVFEPIDIDGSIVERASLHNMSIMEEMLGATPYYGQPIWVIKSNMIIPQITKAIKKDYGDIIAAGGVTVGLGGDYGVLCPVCGSPTSIHTSDSGVKILCCDNEECSGKLSQRIDHFCSKKGLDIKGLSRKTIEKLIDWGYVNSIIDIYKLHSCQMRWMDQPGFGKASVFKILDAIDDSMKNVELASFISALGIPLVGKTIAKQITEYYSTWEDFRNAVGDDWTQFDGFGPEISKAINNFDYTEADEIANILIFKDTEIQSQESLNQPPAIKDKIFCITGKLSHFKNRDELKANIESLGGKVTGSISSKTNYLISNEDSSSAKSIKAKELGISIITEEEYLKMRT